jgi:hypothetical protein
MARPPVEFASCIHRGDIIERIVCRGCGGDREVDVYACEIHKRAHVATANDHRAGMSCRVCAAAGEWFEISPADTAAEAVQIAAPQPGLADS